MKNLIIGSTSQLSLYFPKDWCRISSRQIDFEFIKKSGFDTIYILFAEQRTFLEETEKFFTDINVNYTLEVLDKIKHYCNKVVVFSTSELWNNYEGEVDLSMKYDFIYSPYIKSKEILCNTINEKKEKYQNIRIVYPFNFNSPARKTDFLFGKLFTAFIKKQKVTVENLDFHRDIIHPSTVTKNCLDLNQDILIGSGELTNIRKFIFDLSTLSNMNFIDYIEEKKTSDYKIKRKNFFSKIKYSNYSELLNLTLNDIKKN